MKKLLIVICCLCLFGKTWGDDIVIDDPPDDIPIPDSVLYSTPFVYQSLEIKPTFQGGDFKFFSQWMEKKVNHKNSQQKDAVWVRIMVKIIIDTVGSISEVTVLRSNDEMLSKKVVDALKSSPKWTPGMYGGRLVQTVCILPFYFLVDKKKN